MQTSDQLSDDGWTEPTDASPIDHPDGWHFGEVVHTGGGIYCRIWKNTEEWHPDLDEGDTYHEVVIGADRDGAGLQRYRQTDKDWTAFDGMVAQVSVGTDNPEAALEAAKGLMVAFEYGVFGDE